MACHTPTTRCVGRARGSVRVSHRIVPNCVKKMSSWGHALIGSNWRDFAHAAGTAAFSGLLLLIAAAGLCRPETLTIPNGHPVRVHHAGGDR